MSLSEADRNTLKQVARQAIDYGLHHSHQSPVIDIAEYPESLRPERATFVTLNLNNNLRGCIGSLQAHRPLVLDVAHNACAAAFFDPRFAPLDQTEFEQLDIHLSILSPAEPVQFNSEADLLQQLRPGIDGLILEDKGMRGTFLPSVWESLATAEEFLAHLKQKAGLPARYWSNTLTVSRYTTESF